jgi:hypothetical protein
MVAAPKVARQSKVEWNAKRENLYRQIFAKRNVLQRAAQRETTEDQKMSFCV